MSTQPLPQPPKLATPVVQTWLQAHERLLIVLLVLLAVSWGLHGVLNYEALQAQTRATVAEATLSAAQAQDAKNAQQTAQTLQQYQALVSQLAAQNVALSQAMAARQSALVRQEQVNAQLPLSGLSQGILAQSGAPVGSVSNTESSVVLAQPAAVAVLNVLDSVPVLQANLNDANKIADNEKAQLTSANSVVGVQAIEINGLHTTLVDQGNACKAEVAAAKKRGRLQSFKWFVRGAVTGFFGGLFVGHAI